MHAKLMRPASNGLVESDNSSYFIQFLPK